MAMVPMGGGAGDDLVPLADINITPFVDVVLVLLIIFMVAAPLLSSAVPIELPSSAQSQAPQPQDPLVVSIDREGDVWITDRKVPAAELPGHLADLHGQAPDKTVFLRGDKALTYGRLMEVMENLQGAGFTSIALATEPGRT